MCNSFMTPPSPPTPILGPCDCAFWRWGSSSLSHCGALLSSGSKLSLHSVWPVVGWVLWPVGSASAPPHSGPTPAFSPSVISYFSHLSVHPCASMSAADTFTCVCVCVLSERERERECVGGFEPSVLATNWSKPITPLYFISELLIHVSVTVLPSTPTTAKLA